MKAHELMEILKSIPQETELNFYLIPNDGREDADDENDKILENFQVIYSGGTDAEEPYLDFGLQEPKTYQQKMCDFIRMYTQSDKDDEWIMKYNSLYTELDEMVCNKGFDLDGAIEVIKSLSEKS